LRGKYARLSGALLILNGVACIIGEIGVVANSKLIGWARWSAVRCSWLRWRR
jgi:hypothetical protein